MSQPVSTPGEASPPPKSGLGAALLEALRGSEADYTRIPLRRAIFLLATPMMLELLMESSFAVVDIYFVSKLGSAAVAAVGLTETFLYLLYSIVMGLATAVTAIVARRIGEKRQAEAGAAAGQALLLAVALSLPFAVAGIAYAPQLLELMGGRGEVVTQGQAYTQWMLGGNVVIVLLFVINAVFRGAGDAAVAMRVLWLANGLNMVLDPLLIFGWGPIPAMGIEGAAVATNLGRTGGVAMQVYILFRGSRHIRSSWQSLRPRLATMLHILRTSLGGIGQMIIAMSSWILLMRILSSLGAEAVAGATIALRIALFTLLPAWGLSNAAATLVGQNLGAGHPDRAENAVWKTGFYNMGFLLLVSALYFVYNEALMRLFTTDAAVIAVGGTWLRILSYSYFIYGWWMVATQAFNGAGDTRTPTVINFFFFWCLQLPLAWYLARQLQYGYHGVFWAVFISETSVGLFTLWLFTRGSWKRTRV